MARDQEVVKDAHVCKELAVLEGARHAKRGDGVRPSWWSSRSAKRIVPPVGR